MKDLIEKANRQDNWQKEIKDAETIATRVKGELKIAKVRRVHQGNDELYIDAGNDEASVSFNPKTKQAFVRMVIVREADMTGKSIADVLKKHGVPY